MSDELKHPFTLEPIDITIFEMRERKASYRAIGEAVGMSYEGVRKRWMKIMHQLVPPAEVDLMRTEENLLLDRVQAEAMGVALLRDAEDESLFAHSPYERLNALRVALQASKRKATLNGLDAPRKIVIDGVSRDPLQEYFVQEIAKLEDAANESVGSET